MYTRDLCTYTGCTCVGDDIVVAGAVVVTSLELPVTNTSSLLPDSAFMFPASSTAWGGALEGLVYAQSE